MPATELHSALERARVQLAQGDSFEVARQHLAVRAALTGDAPPELSLGRFVVLERLGQGAMGNVYAAYDRELDRRVAIKLLRRDYGAHADEERARVLREARALARLADPHVVAIYDVGELRGRVFIAMELVVGPTLREHAARTSDWRHVVRIYRDAGAGLAAAHAHGIVHRDFKPDNAMVGADGRVRVLDFGLAHDRGEIATPPDDGSEATLADASATGRVLGTPAYMAPEQHEGRADARSDQFAFCVSLWEALHGERPFRGESPLQILRAQVGQHIAPPPASSRVPAWIRRVLARGLAHDPAQRWPSMAALLGALDRDPSAARRRWLALGTLLVVLALALGSRAWLRAHRLAACNASDVAMQEVWDGSVATRVAAAFAATELPHAPAAAVRLDETLTDSVARWSDVHARACTALDDGSIDEAAFARRELCLREQAEHTAAFVDTLAQPDRELVRRAIELAHELPPAERCEDDARLAGAAALLAVDTDRESVAELRRESARARALAEAGHGTEARAVADGAYAGAQALGDPLVIAEAELGLADAVRIGGDYDEATDEYARAYHHAIALGADELALAIATRLVVVTGLELSRYEQAHDWERQAEALVARLHAEDSELAAALALARGKTASALGERSATEAWYRRAIELYERSGGETHARIGPVEVSLASLLAFGGELEAAEQHAARAERLLATGYGERAAELADVYATRCAVAYFRNDFPEARARCEQALELVREWYGPEHPSVASALSNLAEIRELAGDLREARELLVQALEIRRKRLPLGHPDLAQSIANLAMSDLQLGDFDSGLALMNEALELRRAALPADHEEIVSSWILLGEIRLVRDEPERAAEAAAQALAITAHGDDVATHGRALTLLGRAELGRGRPRAALDALEAALQTPYATLPDAGSRCELRYTLAMAWRASHGARTRGRALERAARAACDEAGDRAPPDVQAEIAAWRD